MMGIALGGVGVISLRVPWSQTSTAVQQLDLSSLILALFLVAVFICTAHLTNPDETSFRNFLTELAFRQHLSRLNGAHVDHDELDDETGPHNPTRPPDDHHPSKNDSGHKNPSINSKSSSESSPVVFHFANKVSVALRTPRYDLRSFGIFTLALVPPSEMAIPPPLGSLHHHPGQLPKPIVWSNPIKHGTCFVGAFGRWWLGLEINMQSRQTRLQVQNDESGDSMRGRVEDGDATMPRQEETSAARSSKPHVPRRTSSTTSARTKAALRERISLQMQQAAAKREHPASPPRPATPPPLPKSASLPLHAKRVPPLPSPETTSGKNTVPNNQPLLPSCSSPPVQLQISTATQDQSPIITELLKQLEAARSATSDLHAQLEEVHAASAKVTAKLEVEVANAREIKRREDDGRAAVRTRTKVLDDARRQADSNKREAEKRFKAVTSQRDDTTKEIERLDRDIDALKRHVNFRKVLADKSEEKTEVERVTLETKLVEKKSELKAAEEHVQGLSARARELEGIINEEADKLDKLKAQKRSGAPWPPPLSSRPTHRNAVSSLGQTPLSLPIPRNSSLDVPSQFYPFADSSVHGCPISPVTASLLPSSLMRSMENPLQEAPRQPSYFPQPDPSSTVSLSQATLHDQPVTIGTQRSIRFDDGPAEVLPDTHRPNVFSHPRPPSPAVLAPKQRRWFSQSKEKGLNPDAKVFTLPARPTTTSIIANGQPHTPDLVPTYSDIFHPGSTRSSQDLRTPESANVIYSSSPDLFNSSSSTPLPDLSKASVNGPNSSSPFRMSLAGSLFPSWQNPFSPSPAEREALQRALSSRNTSGEKVASGSVGTRLERVSSNSSGSSGSLQPSSPHWLQVQAPTKSTSNFDPWASERKA